LGRQSDIVHRYTDCTDVTDFKFWANMAFLKNQQIPKENERTVSRPFVFWFLGLLLIILDQLSKHFIFSIERENLISPFLGLQIFRNYHFAFSLALPAWGMYFIYVLVMALIARHIFKNYREFNFLAALAWTLVLAGAVSNIGERLYFGYVRDFIFVLNGIFNLADGYIVIGIILLLLNRKHVSAINK